MSRRSIRPTSWTVRRRRLVRNSIHGGAFEQADRSRRAADIGGIDHQHRMGCLDIGQQTEAQRPGIDEVGRGFAPSFERSRPSSCTPAPSSHNSTLPNPSTNGGRGDNASARGRRYRPGDIPSALVRAVTSHSTSLRFDRSQHCLAGRVCALPHRPGRRCEATVGCGSATWIGTDCTSCPFAKRCSPRSVKSRAGRGAAAVERIVIEVGPAVRRRAGVARPCLCGRARRELRRGRRAVDRDRRPVIIRCLTCGAQSQTAPNRLVCRVCGGYRTRIVAGDELRLRRVELRVPQLAAA